MVATNDIHSSCTGFLVDNIGVNQKFFDTNGINVLVVQDNENGVSRMDDDDDKRSSLLA